MNNTDKKYIFGTIIFFLILISVEISAYSFSDNILTSSVTYEDRLITAKMEFLSEYNKEEDSRIMQITIMDETANKNVENTIFFLTITHENNDILRKYFFIDNEDLVINVITNNDSKIKMDGLQQYAFDAYVMSPSKNLELKGPFLLENEEYKIKLKLKTIDNIGNIVSRLDPFEFTINSDRINIHKQINLKFNDNTSSSVNFLEFEENNSSHLNNFGFRGPDIDPNNLQNKSRIVLVGGSTVYGAGATSDDTTISGYLQQISIEKIPWENFEIINTGIQGINSDIELTVIKEDILQFNPTMVIVFDGWNDLQDNHSSEKIFKNWNEMCQFGIKNNINMVIGLQPIAGFGNKILTEKETYNAINAVDKFDNKLYSKISQYDEYEDNLSILPEQCLGENFRGVFDNIKSEVYWDEGHLNDYGNNLIAEKLFELYVQDADLQNFQNISIGIENEQIIDDIPITIQDMLSNYKTPNFIKNTIEEWFT